MKLEKFTRGDWNGFWALFADNLANMVILSGVLIGIFNFEEKLVFGRILPGLGVSLLFGLGIYSYFAVKLAKKENRPDVTALPYGISTPVMFVYLFGVIGPVYFKTGDALLAYRIGLAAAFTGGVIEILGSLIGPWLKKITPRAGMLGTLAGIAIVWIATVPLSIIFEHPVIGLPALFIVILGLVGKYRLPFGIPPGLAAIVLGVVIGVSTGESSFHLNDVKVYVPFLMLGDLLAGLKHIFSMPEMFSVVVPISIYNFIETMNNVESAEAAGDKYDVGKCQVVDGAGTIIAAVFGSPFPTTVYIGHPAYKRLGSRVGYSAGVGIIFFVATATGVIAFLKGAIPEAAVAPLLVYVGIVMTQHAFSEIPKGHGIAVGFCLIPHVADILFKQISGTIRVMGESTPMLVESLKIKEGIHLTGYQLLSQGAIITGLLWGAVISLIIDKNLKRAGLFAFLSFILSSVGVIHSAGVGLYLTPVTWGYLILTLMIFSFEFVKPKND